MNTKSDLARYRYGLSIDNSFLEYESLYVVVLAGVLDDAGHVLFCIGVLHAISRKYLDGRS